VEELDLYLSELSDVYSFDNHFRVSIESVIDRLLEIRNVLHKQKREIVIDGDELSKYFRGNRNHDD
jgi:hypothetical protein